MFLTLLTNLHISFRYHNEELKLQKLPAVINAMILSYQ